ncbi:glutamine-hydrolyzing GMP synthase [Bacteroidetes/Chlorobi group bacterium MS-B_bin-24]|nr:MAG: glutamine-hydrolyzing GMP synthase [Bacteroidetes/Chlorobi group bacterium MS-B_bin-24]
MFAMNEKVIILDFGSQYTQLIARKVRECGVYAEIYPYNLNIEEIQRHHPKGIILSGGPASVFDTNAPHPDKKIFSMDIPILGICYGLQLITYHLGGKVGKANKREYGRAVFKIASADPIFEDIPAESIVWMSHGDKIDGIPPNFIILGKTENSISAIRSQNKKIYGLQFHPEVHHTIYGKKILENFLRKVCECKEQWNAASFIETQIKQIREKVGSDEVILALSGGVDSTVAAVLLERAIGNQLHCIHIDTGLMRMNESKNIVELFKKHFKIPITLVEAETLFLERFKGITDPEQKRKIIGNTFIELFEKEAQKFSSAKWLAQGTLYPDVIESTSVRGPSATIKSHHNVGGLPERMNLKVLEPFRELFKDEVRQVGKELGVPDWFIQRHPFPGPGLAIRIIGEVTKERLEILRQADEIFIQEIQNANLYNEIWQAFAVLLPVKSVGVMGDERTYENVCALRAVVSQDGMTADWFKFPYEVLEKASTRIINEVKGINRVVYDITSKPPGTIEWE